ncbi:hypothetical protein [Rhizobium sp. CF142]|uniref:hypothetical protein n=1 Tax=Rhizobium sp. CF142 TaxID=1144314 RepID=UPI001FCC450B|nr:hypothetical protein [Rhizobium sp. CF142]
MRRVKPKRNNPCQQEDDRHRGKEGDLHNQARIWPGTPLQMPYDDARYAEDIQHDDERNDFLRHPVFSSTIITGKHASRRLEVQQPASWNEIASELAPVGLCPTPGSRKAGWRRLGFTRVEIETSEFEQQFQPIE